MHHHQSSSPLSPSPLPARASAALALLLSVSACGSLTAKIEREQIAGASVEFTAVGMNYGFRSWTYEFKTDGSSVLGCNSSKVYKASGWTFDEAKQSVKVNFGTQFEKYTLEANSDAFDTGTFEYSNSNPGQLMSGTWKKLSSKPCTAR